VWRGVPYLPLPYLLPQEGTLSLSSPLLDTAARVAVESGGGGGGGGALGGLGSAGAGGATVWGPFATCLDPRRACPFTHTSTPVEQAPGPLATYLKCETNALRPQLSVCEPVCALNGEYTTAA